MQAHSGAMTRHAQIGGSGTATSCCHDGRSSDPEPTDAMLPTLSESKAEEQVQQVTRVDVFFVAVLEAPSVRRTGLLM